MTRTLGLGWLLAISFTLSIHAQQFQEQVAALPGPIVWTESCEAFDANGDGWMDIMFTNGIGFSSAQGTLAPTLLINQAVVGQAVFLDETATRLPVGFAQQGKGMCICDVDGDGDEDILFANAFGNQPNILINDGLGVFTDETATRLPVMLLNSYGVNFGDLDDDGDLDLVFGDAGGLARLLINNGSGFFTDSPLKMNAVTKAGAMQINIVDVDNDYDLDVIVDGKSVGQQLYRNDGSANFIYQASVLPDGTGLTYETDWADLDNDNDVDGVYISMSGFSEGIARNNFVGSGSLSFSSSTGIFGGLNGLDDNEAAFIDANNDGFLDVLIASLGNNQERLYLNSGTLVAGSLSFQAGAFTSLTDSTLDLCIADFDNNGTYDVVTAQGESSIFLNRYYKNTGPADTVPPRIVRLQNLPGTIGVSDLLNGGIRVRTWCQDATYDNGRNFISAELMVTTTKGAFSASSTYAMQAIGGGLYSGVVNPPLPPNGLVGATVSYAVIATDPQLNSGMSVTKSFSVDGVEPYDTLLGPPSSLMAAWVPDGGDATSATGTITVTGATPGALGIVGGSLAPADLTIFGFPLLIAVDSSNLIINGNFGYGFAGELIVPAVSRQQPFIAGSVLHLQFFESSPIPASSNGLRMLLVP